MLPRCNVLLLCLFWCIGTQLSASSFYFDKITTRSGLSQSSVFSIIQDHRGFMWFGTLDGLNQYNGHEFTVFRYKKNDPHSIANNDIKVLFEDHKHRLWVGFFQGGLNYYNAETDQFVRFTRTVEGEKLAGVIVNGFAEDQRGMLWIASTQGLFWLDAKGQIHHHRGALSQEAISSVFTDQQGNLWLGTMKGKVWRKKANTQIFEEFKLQIDDKELASSRINCLFQTQRGDILAGTKGQGLFKLHPQNRVFASIIYFPGELEGRNNVLKLASKGKHLWIGTDGGLIHADNNLSSGSFEWIKAAPNRKGFLSSHAVLDICFDRFANLWIGLWEAGGVNVIYSHNPPFRRLSTADGLPVNRVSGVAYARGKHYVGTSKGVVIFDQNFKKIGDLLSDKDVNGIAYNDQYLLFGVWNEGFYLYSTQTGELQHFTKPNTPGFEGVLRLTFAALTDDGAWICISQNGGLIYRLDFATRKILPLTRLKSASWVSAICKSTQPNTLWVGTSNEGLWRYNLQSHAWTSIRLNDKLEDTPNERDIVCMERDSPHRFWVGTRGAGLFLLDESGKVLHHYDSENGLANGVIHSVQKDHLGTLWVSTNDGLSRFNPKDHSFRNYGEKDDLGGKEFIDGAGSRGAAGHLLFGGVHGLNVFSPDSIMDNPVKPIPTITDLLLLNKKTTPQSKNSPLQQTIDFARKIRLPYHQAVSITFEYVGIYFQRNAQCTYAYQLEGFDRKWNIVGSRRAATYTNLNPGHYVFKVKAANAEGSWGNTIKSIELQILPPWYLQWWAFVVYGLIVITLLIQYRNYIRNRERLNSTLRLKELEAANARQLEQLKTDFFTNISHEFRTPLTLILDPAERLSTGHDFNSNQVKNLASIIRSNAQRLSRLVNQLLDLAKIEADKYQLHIEFQDLISQCRNVLQAFQLQTEVQKVEMRFKAPVEELFAWFDADALDKMLYNLLSNALKANPSLLELSIAITYDEQGLARSCQITVQDNGSGISEEQLPSLFKRFFQGQSNSNLLQPGTGIGLSLVAELARIHGGQIEVRSSVPTGSTFTLSLSIHATAFPATWLAGQPIQPLTPTAEEVTLITSGLEEQGADDARKLVLIVEDNAEMRTYLQEYFSRNFNVITCDNGQDAYQEAMQQIPDLIISDLIMPIMDGLALCTAVKAHELTSHIPVILLTSRASVASQLTGLQAGADDYVTKPFHLDLLYTRALNLIKQRELLSARVARTSLHSLSHKELQISETDANFLKKAIAIIDANLEDPDFGVEELEAALFMGKMQLYRKLTSLAGMSGNTFIRHIRLQRAAELLEKSNLTVAEVAYRVGFNTPSYFTQMYKKTFGKLPSEPLSK